MAFSLNGVRVPHRKHTASCSATPMTDIRTVTIPMSMHIGAPAKPCVKVGDLVSVGTLIAEAGGFVSAPIHASVSGKVTKIADFLLSSGQTVPAVVIESDGLMTPDPALQPPAVDSRESLLEAIKQSGVVGLGGAGFPTHVKFNVDPARIEHLIVNGAECEPYITSDTRTMLDRVDDMMTALRAMAAHLGIKNVVIGIEANKKEAITSMRMMAAALRDHCSVTVKVLPSVYPQGGEKVLIYHTVGRTVPMGKLPIDVGCVVVNCTTLAAIGEYLATGMPLVQKCVTVDGGAVKEPKNILVPIGTPLSAVFDVAHGAGLAVVHPNYMKYFCKYAPERYARYAINVWGVDPAGKTNLEVSQEGVQRTRDFFHEIGAPATLAELGIPESAIDDLAARADLSCWAYKEMTREDVTAILHMAK